MPMNFCFYPDHQYGCEHVGHCPHLGGAALGTVVREANENDHFLQYLHGTIAGDRERIDQLYEENERLKRELEQVKLELKLERQNKFATNQQKEVPTSEAENNRPDSSVSGQIKGVRPL
jgi:hypothetical protein